MYMCGTVAAENGQILQSVGVIGGGTQDVVTYSLPAA